MREVVDLPTATADDAVRRLLYEGWCQLDDAVSADAVEQLRTVVINIVDARGATADGAPGRRLVDGLLSFDQSWAGLLAEPRLSGAMTTLHNADWRLGLHAAVVVAGGGRGSWYADWPFQAGHEQLQVGVPYGDLSMSLSAVVCLDDAAGLWVVPGSHRNSSNPGRGDAPSADEDVSSARLIPARSGSMVVMDGRLWRADAALSSRDGHLHARLELNCIPWWVSAAPLLPGLSDYELAAAGARSSSVPGRRVLPVSAEIYDALSDEVKPRVRHLMAGQQVVPE